MERPDHGKPGNALDRRQVLRGIAAAGAMAGAGGLLGALLLLGRRRARRAAVPDQRGQARGAAP